MTHVIESLPLALLRHVAELSLVILIVGSLTAATWRKHPHLAHALWALVVVKCLLPPGLTSPFGVIPAFESTGLVIAKPVARTKVVLRIGSSPVVDGKIQSSSAVGTANVSDTVVQPQADETDLADTYRGQRSLAGALMAAWICGSLTLVIWTLARWAVAWRRWHHDMRPASSTTASAVQHLCERLCCRRDIRVVVSRMNLGPMLLGCWRPTIVLPENLVASCSSEDLNLVLAHEIIHARRGDILWGVLQWMSRVIWWFHPLVWWANRQLDWICEVCCDEEVVSGLACPPRAYAQCLVNVAELRQHLRFLPVVPASRPTRVTKTRLRYLMHKQHRFGSRVPRWVPVFAVALSVTLFPTSRPRLDAQSPANPANPANQANHPATPGTEESLELQADDAFMNQRWEEAADAYGKLTLEKPDRADFWFRRGYALHALGRIDEAIKAHRKASTFQQIRRVALYNLACAYSLKGRTHESLDALSSAIDAGFRSATPVEDDRDFAGIVREPEFKRLAALARLKGSDEYRQLDFWIGTWNVLDESGQSIGRAEVLQDEDGHLTTEKWRAHAGDTGTGISFFDPGQRMWRQTWVDSRGAVSTYTGNFAAGRMEFTGETVHVSGRKVLSRSTLEPLGDGTVALTMQASEDGLSWETIFRGKYVRVNSDTNVE